jgi:hypothetical protein
MEKKQLKSKSSTTGWKMIGVRMQPDLVKAIKRYALENDTSMQEVTIEALQDFLKKHGVKVLKEMP